MPVIEFIEPAPKGFNISREAWAKTPEIMRSEILRAHRELSECIPIQKDRAARRGSRKPGGHWELHCCERERNPSPTQLARAAELREALASEIAHHAAVEAHARDLAPYYAMAAAAGKELPDVLRAYIGVEHRLRADPHKEICRIMEAVEIDVYEWAQRVLAEPEVA